MNNLANKAHTEDRQKAALDLDIAQRYPLSRSWAEVKLDAIRHNVQQLKKRLHGQTRLLCVVKADAYGHGASEVVGTLEEAGAAYLAVSMLDEGIELRKQGVSLPILILSYTHPSRAEEILRYDLTQTIYDRPLAEALAAFAAKNKKKARIHLKVDTGMGRVGFACQKKACEEILQIASSPYFEVEGIYTHFSTADEVDLTYTKKQFERFMDVCEVLQRAGLDIPLRHCCNSAATLRCPDMHLDMVRPGLALYGVMPSACEQEAANFETAMALHSEIIHLKEVDAGEPISYGRHFWTEQKSRIATIPIGYADGYARRLSNLAWVGLTGGRAKVCGSICMDACMLDVTALDPAPEQGDPVLIFGQSRLNRRRDGTFTSSSESLLTGPTVDQLAAWAGNISYEMLCLIGKRVPRVYTDGGRILRVRTLIDSF